MVIQIGIEHFVLNADDASLTIGSAKTTNQRGLARTRSSGSSLASLVGSGCPTGQSMSRFRWSQLSYLRRCPKEEPMRSQSLTVLQAADVKPGELAALDVKGVRIALANVNGQLFAIDELCTHQQCSLAEDGTLEGAVVTCGCHGAQFDVTTGQVLAPPAVEPLKVYPLHVEGGQIVVEV
jgi:nitrite reductase/ring-hydroxylating ferredoxin subunit